MQDLSEPDFDTLEPVFESRLKKVPQRVPKPIETTEEIPPMRKVHHSSIIFLILDEFSTPGDRKFSEILMSFNMLLALRTAYKMFSQMSVLSVFPVMMLFLVEYGRSKKNIMMSMGAAFLSMLLALVYGRLVSLFLRMIATLGGEAFYLF